MDTPETSPKAIREARDIGITAGLKYVYAGNLPGDDGENTYCPKCNELLVRREAYNILENKIVKGSCPKCGTKIDGKWS